jgi:peroxin-16
MAKSSPLYKRLALLLQLLLHTELLWEMVAKRKGEKVRWRVVVSLEAIKAVCRIVLLRLTNSRMLVSPALPEREVDPSKLEEAKEKVEEKESGEDIVESGSETLVGSEASTWTMPRTGLVLPSLPDAGDLSNYLISRVMKADDIKPPKSLMHRISGKGELAEILYILRPVLYALAMQHWSGDKKSWKPWLIGLSIEYGAQQLAKKDFQDRIAGGLRGLTGLEKEEMRKRAVSLGWWVMRGAFYENVTR